SCSKIIRTPGKGNRCFPAVVDGYPQYLIADPLSDLFNRTILLSDMNTVRIQFKRQFNIIIYNKRNSGFTAIVLHFFSNGIFLLPLQGITPFFPELKKCNSSIERFPENSYRILPAIGSSQNKINT